MAVTPLNIERQINARLQALLNAESYVSTNSLSVRDWYSQTDEATGQAIVVHTEKAVPSILDASGKAEQFEVRCNLLAYWHVADDQLPGAETNTIYEFLFGFADALLIADVQSGLSGITIDGRTTAENTESYDDRFFNGGVSFSLFAE